MKRFFLIALATVVGLIGAGLIALQVSPVQRALGRMVSKKLPGGVEIERVVLTLPTTITLVGVSAEGVAVDAIEAVWRPSALFCKTLAFREVVVTGVELSESEGSSAPLSWPNLPLDLSIEALRLETEEIRLEGLIMAESGGGDFWANLTVTPLQGPLAPFALEIEGSAATQEISVEGWSIAEGECLSEGGVCLNSFRIEAFGNVGDWGAVASGTGNGGVLGSFHLQVAREAGAKGLLPDLIGEEGEVEGVFSLDGNRLLLLRPISGDAKGVRLQGRVEATLGGEIREANLIATLKGTSPLTAKISLSGQTSQPKLHLLVEDAKGLSAQAEIVIDGSTAHLEGQLQFGQESFPVRAELAWAETYTLDLEIGDGSLALSYAPQALDQLVALRARKLPLDLLEIVDPRLTVTGLLNATATLSADESGVVEIDWEGVEMKDPLIVDIQAISGRIVGRLEKGQFDLALTLDSRTGSPLNAHVSIPVNVTTSPLTFDIPLDGPLSGAGYFDAQLRPLLQFILPGMVNVAGIVSADLKVAGTAGDPEIRGTLTIRDGAFEDFYSGTAFHNLYARFVAEGSQVKLETMEADDGQGGKLRARGAVELSTIRDYPFQMTIQLERAKLVGIDLATAIFSGDLAFGGTLMAPKLAGQLVADEVLINLEKGLPPRIPRLNVTYVNVPPSQQHKTKQEHLVDIGLDLSLTTGKNARLDGKGIKSEWKGAIQVAGTANTPQLQGELGLVKGDFDLGGKPFKLTQGKITFAGPPETGTTLNIVGTLELDDIEIYANLAGTLPDVSLTFYSSPSMSTQEILSYLIFGRPLLDADTNQLEKLEQASIDINEGDYGSNFITEFQKGIGLDEFTISAPDPATEEYGILAGKKVSKNFEVYVYRSVNQEYNRTRVILEFYGQWRLVGEVGNEDGERFSLVWHRNY